MGIMYVTCNVMNPLAYRVHDPYIATHLTIHKPQTRLFPASRYGFVAFTIYVADMIFIYIRLTSHLLD